MFTLLSLPMLPNYGKESGAHPCRFFAITKSLYPPVKLLDFSESADKKQCLHKMAVVVVHLHQQAIYGLFSNFQEFMLKV